MRALCLLLLVASPALAYESVCFQYSDETKQVATLDATTRFTCLPAGGPNTARHRWVGPLDEHRVLFEQARVAAGLPTSVSDTFQLKTFTSDATLTIGVKRVGTLVPTPFAMALRSQSRPLSVGELSELADFSYGLWDWASGNESCPVTGNGDATTCHDFATHMGPVNSNHFLPQSRGFFNSYHRLALARADDCKAMGDALGAQRPRFVAFVEQCELEALGLEAMAQHYLQDAWSTGHMWGRWGSPELSDFPGDGFEPRGRAELVALIAGMIHGSRAVLQKLPQWTSFDVDDALCAPQETVRYLHAGEIRQGLGDDYLNQLPAIGDASAFGYQATQLMSCAASSLAEVYARAGQQHGVAGAPMAGLRSVIVDSEACFGQRVTNEALATGAALQFKTAGQQVNLPLDSRFIGWMVPRVAGPFGEVIVDRKLRAEFRFSLMRAMTRLRLLAKTHPDGTEAADGAMGPLVGVAPNTGFAARSPLSSYVDPPLPWPGASSRPPVELARAQSLALLFNRAHATDWCAQTDAAALSALQAHVADPGLDAQAKVAACEACVEIAARHLRLGTGPLAYDVSQEPLCRLLSPTAAVVYQPAPAVGGSAAKNFCGCP